MGGAATSGKYKYNADHTLRNIYRHFICVYFMSVSQSDLAGAGCCSGLITQRI